MQGGIRYSVIRSGFVDASVRFQTNDPAWSHPRGMDRATRQVNPVAGDRLDKTDNNIQELLSVYPFCGAIR